MVMKESEDTPKALLMSHAAALFLLGETACLPSASPSS